MPACKGTFSDGKPCSKTVKRGRKFCQWHDPEDESWREVYARLKKATPEEKTDIVLRLIEDHPEHKLVLPERDGKKADLSKVDLSRETLDKRRKQSGFEEPSWWNTKDNRGGANLFLAELQGAILLTANLQGAFLAGVKLQGAELGFAKLQGAIFGDPIRQGNPIFNANLRNASLVYSNLEGAFLAGANLQEADLKGAKLQRAHLNRANLQAAHLEEANLQDALLGGANLSDTYLYAANFQTAQLQFANLQNAHLDGANLQNADFHSSNLQGASLVDAKLQGVDLSIVQNMTNVYLRAAWLDRTRMRKEQLGGAIGEELQSDFASAKSGYLALKQNFDDLGDYEASSWSYRKERRMEKLKALQEGIYFKFFSDTLVEWLCDYGESVWRVIGWMAVLLFVIGPSMFSVLGGVVWEKDIAQNYFALSSSWGRFWFWYRLYLLYTLDTFTTASFSGLQPINDAVKFASGLFAIAGIVLAGLLGFVAGNRIRRS